jgi:hypothetical protein
MGDDPAPRKWLHSKSRRSRIASPLRVSMATVPGEPNVTYTRPGSITGVGEA